MQYFFREVYWEWLLISDPFKQGGWWPHNQGRFVVGSTASDKSADPGERIQWVQRFGFGTSSKVATRNSVNEEKEWNSKVVSTHRTGTHPEKTFTNRLYYGNPFILGWLPGVCDIGVCCNFLGETDWSIGGIWGSFNNSYKFRLYQIVTEFWCFFLSNECN